MIDALLTMVMPGVVSGAAPGMAVMPGEAAKPAMPEAKGFGAALALMLAPNEVAAPGEMVAALPVPAADVGAVGAGAEPLPPLAGQAMPKAVATGEGTPVPAVAAAAVAGDAELVSAPAEGGVGHHRPARLLPAHAMALVRAPVAEAAAGGGEPRVERRLKNVSGAKPLAEAGETAAQPVPVPVVLGWVAQPLAGATPVETRLVAAGPGTGAVPAMMPPAAKPVAETPVAVAAVGRTTPAAMQPVPDMVPPPGGAAPVIAGAALVETSAGVVPAAVTAAERPALPALGNRPGAENPVLPVRFVADLPLPPVVAAVVPEPRGQGARREFDAVPVAEPVVSGAASVGLPGVSGGNPVVRGAAGDAPPVAQPVPARVEQAFSVASDALGPVDIGVDGGGEDLRVRFSADVAAARVMAAEAPRLLADLAAQGVRVQALAFDGRVEPGAEPGLAAGADGSPSQQPSGQLGGQPGFAAGRQPAALPEPAVTGSGAGARAPRISERYA